MNEQSVCCVFQRLPGERCPSLAAICATRAVADDLVRMSEEDERQQGKPASVWTVETWSVLDGEVAKIGDIQQISDAMDPMRDGVLPEAASDPDGSTDGDGGDVGDDGATEFRGTGG
ncbi:MAG TPA: hypothetical protein VFH27_13570 [Longimicrobiaceae bacterium]|nr:hypothetical protein [Longimicrobiaceae bacterium]